MKKKINPAAYTYSVNLLCFGIDFLSFFPMSLEGFLRKLEKTLHSVYNPSCTLSIFLLLINTLKHFSVLFFFIVSNAVRNIFSLSPDCLQRIKF